MEEKGRKGTYFYKMAKNNNNKNKKKNKEKATSKTVAELTVKKHMKSQFLIVSLKVLVLSIIDNLYNLPP